MIWLKLACTYRLDTLWTPTEAWIIGKLSWNCSFLLLLTVQSQFSKRSDGNSVHLLGLGVRHWRKRFSVSTKNSKSYHPFFVLEVLNQWERMYKYTMKCTNYRTFKFTACQGLLSYRRQIGKQEDPGDEVGGEPPCKSLVQRSRMLMQKRPLFGQTQRQINIYSSQLIIDDISATTLRLIL